MQVVEGAEHNKWDSEKDEEMPLLVYVAREKRPSHKHNFKAGALNVLVIKPHIHFINSMSFFLIMFSCSFVYQA